MSGGPEAPIRLNRHDTDLASDLSHRHVLAPCELDASIGARRRRVWAAHERRVWGAEVRVKTDHRQG